MPVVVGIDLGTTTLTAVALDPAAGELSACFTAPTPGRLPAGDPGRSEWDVTALAERACACLRGVADRLGPRRAEVVGLGLTGQQHGGVLVDAALRPLTPFVGWQDRRGEDPYPGGGTYTERARALAGPEAPGRTGCRLATGYLAVTLFWMRQRGVLPPPGTACLATDYFAALLTGRPPVTDPTCAASAGVFDLRRGDWDPALLEALGLPAGLFPPVRPSGELCGPLTAARAEQTGLPAGLPVFVGVGDNQASFLGSVAARADSVLVNVGTGGQVAAHADAFHADALLETRPFPGGGFLLVAAGLSGGAAYATLERFFRAVVTDVAGAADPDALFAAMNRLAAAAPAGADGLRCEPFFAGTRANPELRASWTGMSAANFTPGHLARALLEGMARTFAGGYERIGAARGRPVRRLVGAGNGLRANPLLARLVAAEFGLPLLLPASQEEAAVGAALLAGVGAGLFPDLAAAGAALRYVEPPPP
jgi:sugar (pentulose or hexulose) kinase